MAGFLHGAAGEQFLDLEGLLNQDILDIVRKVINLVLLGLWLQLGWLLQLRREFELELFEFCLVPEVVAWPAYYFLGFLGVIWEVVAGDGEMFLLAGLGLESDW